MKITRFKLALLSYVLFDLLIGGHCGGLLPLALAQSAQAVGNITSAATTCSITAVPTNCVVLQLDAASGAASIDISGTWAATLQIEAFGGVTWAAINCTPPNSTTAVSSTTANGVWQCNVAGFSAIRIRASAYTSGTAAVVINSAHASAKSGGGAVYASGLGTSNVIPKGNGAGQLADSSITDNGTNVISTETLIVPVGSTSNASIQPAGGSANTGYYFSNTSTPAVVVGGNQVAAFGFSSGSNINLVGGGSASWYAINSDLFLGRRGAGNFKLGALDLNGAPVAQTISVQNAITGTDLAGSTFTIDAPLGTGAGAGSSTKLNRAQILATGTTAQTSANAFVVCETKILSNTSATTTAIATIALASNSGGGASVFHSLTATDATNFDSETQSYNVSYVNKAGTITVGSLATTASTAANNSGSATIGATVTGATPTISLKVTPVYTTIVPTTVTLYTTIINHGAGAVTCN